MRLNERPNSREILLIIGHGGLAYTFEILEYDLKCLDKWKWDYEFMSLDLLGPTILTKYPNYIQSFFLKTKHMGVMFETFKQYTTQIDQTDLQDICFWRTFGMLMMVYPMTIQFGSRVHNAMRVLKIGGKNLPLDTDFLPEIGPVSVCINQERSRYLVTGNLAGHLRRFRLMGKKRFIIEQVDEWKMELQHLTFMKENYAKRAVFLGTGQGEVILAKIKEKETLQKIQFGFPIHWIFERNFDNKQVQLLVTGPEPSKMEAWPIIEKNFKKGYEKPKKFISEDNPFLKNAMMAGSEEDEDSEMGKEFRKLAGFKRRKTKDLPKKPLTLKEILE